MFNASVLVRNVHLISPPSPNLVGGVALRESLDSGEFTIREIDSRRLSDLQELFDSKEVSPNDYVLEKAYAVAPPVSHLSPAGVGGIPEDIEDLLLLLRLFRIGDLAFVKLAINRPDGTIRRMVPYRVINALNSYSETTELRQTERAEWQTFATRLRASPSWKAPWFEVARRFFLYGGSKEFNPPNGDVDRIVDYVTALEAALVPEKGFLGRRLRNRAAALLSSDPIKQAAEIALLKRLYDVRSSIVHGSVLGKSTLAWLVRNRKDVEFTVTAILSAAVVRIPADDIERTQALQSLYDVTDGDRADSVFQQFSEIKDKNIRADCAVKIGNKA